MDIESDIETLERLKASEEKAKKLLNDALININKVYGLEVINAGSGNYHYIISMLKNKKNSIDYNTW